MSLAIDVDEVTGVLIAGKWYGVWDHTLSCDAYEYVWHSGADRSRPPDVFSVPESQLGFSFVTRPTSKGPLHRMYGPITAIQAVSYVETYPHEE